MKSSDKRVHGQRRRYESNKELHGSTTEIATYQVSIPTYERKRCSKVRKQFARGKLSSAKQNGGLVPNCTLGRKGGNR